MPEKTATMKRLICLLITSIFLLISPAAAYADYGSGTGPGPVGVPVISTVPYVQRSDVLIVGDSITVRGYKDLAAALPGKRLAVNAWSGRATKTSVDAVLAMPYVPPVLIMAVGSNDVFDPPGMAAQVRRLLAGVPTSTKVFWVDVQVARPTTAVADQRNSMWVNQAIWRECVGECTVISWSTFLAAKPYRISRYLDSRGVHPIVGVGTRAWAALIADSVNRAS